MRRSKQLKIISNNITLRIIVNQTIILDSIINRPKLTTILIANVYKHKIPFILTSSNFAKSKIKIIPILIRLLKNKIEKPQIH